MQYNTEDTLLAWEILDGYFRGMPTGTVLRVDHREDTLGQTIITHGTYQKGLSKDGQFALITGKPMFHGTNGEFIGGTSGSADLPETQDVYPDEMVQANNFDELRFRIITLGASNV